MKERSSFRSGSITPKYLIAVVHEIGKAVARALRPRYDDSGSDVRLATRHLRPASP